MPVPSSPTRLAIGVAALCLPALVAGQPAAPTPDSAAQRSHEVRRGETLWALADQFLGDPYRWPAIHAVNAAVVANPHWIYPGQVLRIPGVPAPEAPAPVDSAVRPEVEDGGVPPEATAFARAPEGAVRPAPAVPAGPVRRIVQDSAPRSAAWLAAPYVAGPDALRGAGRIVDGVDIPTARLRSSRARFQLMDHVVLRLPAGARSDSGAAYVVASTGPTLRGSDVIVPLAVAVLDGGGEGALRTARLVRVFGLVEPGQPIVPLVADASTTPGAAAAATHVLWVRGAAELPTLQSYVVLGRGARDGVRAGDRYELLGDGRRTPEGESLPKVRVGVVRVVRVTADAATALVIHHDQPAIAAGMEARPLPR